MLTTQESNQPPLNRMACKYVRERKSEKKNGGGRDEQPTILVSSLFRKDA